MKTNKTHSYRRSRDSGFTLIEFMAVTAIIGILISAAFPVIILYSTKAKVIEGVLLLTELRRRVEVGFNRTRELDVVIPSSPPADGPKFGGPYYLYSTLFDGEESDMWESFEYQIKSPIECLCYVHTGNQSGGILILACIYR